MSGLSEDTIKDNAEGPKRAMGDGHSVDQHSLTDQIKADEYLANKNAMGKTTLPIRLAKIRPGGAI